MYLQLTGSQREPDSLSPQLDFISAIKMHTRLPGSLVLLVQAGSANMAVSITVTGLVA